MLVDGAAYAGILQWIWPPLLIAFVVWITIWAHRRFTGFRRILITLLLALPLLAGLGAVYESVGSLLDRRTHRPPGELVQLAGGARLHLNCTGTGNPTVLLEAMSGGVSPVWGWVQPALAEETTVCSYDRPGRGWSHPVDDPQDAEQVAVQLRELLDKAEVEGPYLPVGHSLGGLYARMFAARYPDEVAGMVLLDAAHPEQFDRTPGEREQFESFRSLQRTFSPMARIGIWRAYFDLGGSFDFGGLPDADLARMKAIWSSPQLFQSQRRELDAITDIHRQVRPLGSLGSLPLMVISAGEQPQDWLQLQSEMAGLSANSSHRTIEGATHLALVFDEEVARKVGEAVLEVVEASRNSSGL